MSGRLDEEVESGLVSMRGRCEEGRNRVSGPMCVGVHVSQNVWHRCGVGKRGKVVGLWGGVNVGMDVWEDEEYVGDRRVWGREGG